MGINANPRSAMDEQKNGVIYVFGPALSIATDQFADAHGLEAVDAVG